VRAISTGGAWQDAGVSSQPPVSFWLREPPPPGIADPPLEPGEQLKADVAIIGAGFTGLWTAIALTDTDPTLSVVVLEMESVGFGASGRNGGFCEASLTHGLANGIRHFPDELEILEREGIENLRGLIAFTREHEIDCDLEETGTLALADQPYQVDEFRAWVDEAAEYGEQLEFLDRDAAMAEVHSPLWQAGLYRPPGRDVLLDPAKLCRGLARVARERGIRIHEHTRVTGLARRAGHVAVAAVNGAVVRADQVVVATSAYSGWLSRLGGTFVPVYDYALVSEPLGPEQRAAIGWGPAAGPVRREQPVPLLPTHRRRPHPVGRLRRDPLPR
jgi:glycine/D-amino acid oxidase-like deaminating enzyme